MTDYVATSGIHQHQQKSSSLETPLRAFRCEPSAAASRDGSGGKTAVVETAEGRIKGGKEDEDDTGQGNSEVDDQQQKLQLQQTDPNSKGKLQEQQGGRGVSVAQRPPSANLFFFSSRRSRQQQQQLREQRAGSIDRPKTSGAADNIVFMGLENGAEDVSDGRRPMPKPRHLFATQNSSHQPSSNNNNNNNDKKDKNDRDSINNDNNEVGPFGVPMINKIRSK
jgi:hypothetical protein